jgi:hypothetical protein
MGIASDSCDTLFKPNGCTSLTEMAAEIEELRSRGASRDLHATPMPKDGPKSE